MPGSPAPALVLFDIDGTLVRRAGPHHKQALVDAVRDVTGLETSTDGIPLYGMLDPDILTRMMANAGAPARRIRQSLPAIIRRAQWRYVRTVPNLERKTCPGARSLLRRLYARGVLLGLVTGNLTRIGWKKMERAGLKSYFSLGAFGEEARTRTGLVRLAIERAAMPPRTPICLIGDAPADVIAAKKNKIRSIAVYTGISKPENLQACGPDLLVENLRAPEIAAFLRI